MGHTFYASQYVLWQQAISRILNILQTLTVCQKLRVLLVKKLLLVSSLLAFKLKIAQVLGAKSHHKDSVISVRWECSRYLLPVAEKNLTAT